MAHNMDVANAAEAAEKSYQALIEITPPTKRAAIQTEYGSFLASSARPQAALEMLESAVQAGESAAEFDLALVWLALGDINKALAHLRHYHRHYPQDTRAETLIEAIESGKIEKHSAPLKE